LLIFAGVVAMYVAGLVPFLQGPLGTNTLRWSLFLLWCCCCVSVRVVLRWLLELSIEFKRLDLWTVTCNSVGRWLCFIRELKSKSRLLSDPTLLDVQEHTALFEGSHISTVTLLAPKIWREFPHVWKICGPLIWKIHTLCEKYRLLELHLTVNKQTTTL